MKSHDGGTLLIDGSRQVRILFMTPEIVRITMADGRAFSRDTSLIVTLEGSCADIEVREETEAYVICSTRLKLVVNRETGSISYHAADGAPLLQEADNGGKTLIPKKVYRNVFHEGGVIDSGISIDGARAVATEFETVFDRDAFEARLELQFTSEEAIFGLGSHEEGNGNLRGKSIDLYQQNMKIAVPVLVSTNGYGLMMDCCSLMTFTDGSNGASWWADVVEELDYYFIGGGSFDNVTANLRELTGAAPMLPKWAFGYAQSKERYVNAAEMLDVVREYRHREIPLDLIILDWKSWPNGNGWGQKCFDPERFPDPEELTRTLHQLGARLMVSIWPLMTGNCPDQQEMLANGWMLGNQATYDAFNPEARACYWRQTNQGLFSQGVDGWWCDCTEPFEADWSGAVKPDRDERLRINTEEAKKYLDEGLINAYSLLHSKGIFEGQRATSSRKRVLNLTRSGYAGQHRYGTVCWNGDICGTWDSLRRCIPEGLNFCATGQPYWTLDIGGFFVANQPDAWFWSGDYDDGCRGLTGHDRLEPNPDDTGCKDLGYWELYTRWLQYATFLPMFRSHGTDAPREAWRFGGQGSPFYDTIVQFIRLRYRLMPYIYSLAGQVALSGRTMMRPLALDFPNDTQTHWITDQFLFGPALLICPVTRPMYFESGSRERFDVPKFRTVYLPVGTRWYDFWTGERFEGGAALDVDARLETMPLFVRAGSILPMTEPMQYVDERTDVPLELRVYTGADGAFTLYEDAGDGYAYEDGAFATVDLHWFEDRKILEFSARRGAFDEMVPEQTWQIRFIAPGRVLETTLLYKGQAGTASPPAILK